jgi:serine/threonine protein kinase
VSDLVRNLPNSLLLEDFTNSYMKIDSINSGGFGEVTKFLDTKTLNHIAGKLIKFSFKMVEFSQQKKVFPLPANFSSKCTISLAFRVISIRICQNQIGMSKIWIFNQLFCYIYNAWSSYSLVDVLRKWLSERPAKRRRRFSRKTSLKIFLSGIFRFYIVINFFCLKSLQTLKALLVLHNHSPPIIHGNIKGDLLYRLKIIFGY